MNSIAKMEQQLPATVGGKIATIAPVELEKGLVPILLRAHQIMGYKVDNADVYFICGELEHMLREKYRMLTLSDIESAVIAGASGSYDEVKSISVRSVVGWIRAYLSERNREQLNQSNEANVPMHVTATSLLKGLIEHFPDFEKTLDEAGKKWRRV